MKKKQTFEQAMKRLEEISQKLEVGEISLEESLALYEEGIQLISYCQDRLDEAEKKVQKLIRKEGGEFETTSLDGPSSGVED